MTRLFLSPRRPTRWGERGEVASASLTSPAISPLSPSPIAEAGRPKSQQNQSSPQSPRSPRENKYQAQRTRPSWDDVDGWRRLYAQADDLEGQARGGAAAGARGWRQGRRWRHRPAGRSAPLPRAGGAEDAGLHGRADGHDGGGALRSHFCRSPGARRIVHHRRRSAAPVPSANTPRLVLEFATFERID